MSQEKPTRNQVLAGCIHPLFSYLVFTSDDFQDENLKTDCRITLFKRLDDLGKPNRGDGSKRTDSYGSRHEMCKRRHGRFSVVICNDDFLDSRFRC